MPVDVQTQIVIERPRAEVAAFVGDPMNATAWYENIASVRPKYSGAVAVGSRAEFVARFLGRRLAYTYEVREFVEGERNRGNPTGFSKIAAPLMEATMRRANRKDLERLRALLERQ